MKARLLFGVAAVLVAAGLLVAFRPASRQSTTVHGRAIGGKPAPAFSTRDLDGRALRLEDFRGTTVLLNFWASWCVPCREEFPVLADVPSRHPGVRVLGVVFNDSPASAKKFMAAHGGSWPGLSDPDGRIAVAYGVGFKPGLPMTIVIDRDGVIRGRHVGQANVGDIDTLVARATTTPAA